MGATQYGHRRVLAVSGGMATGSRLTPSFPKGGFDFELTLSNGTIGLEQDRLRGRELVVVRSCGPFGALVPWFETRADGPYGFLNTQGYVSSDPGSGSGGVSITVYELK